MTETMREKGMTRNTSNKTVKVMRTKKKMKPELKSLIFKKDPSPPSLPRATNPNDRSRSQL